MRHLKYFTATLLCTMPMVLTADIYDVLRGTPNSNNLSYKDVQNANAAASTVFTPQQMQQLQAESNAQSQGQAMASNTASGQPTYKPTTLREEAFQELLNKTFPLLPSQIEELHKHYDQTQIAINTPPGTPPQPVSSTLNVDLSPGATPPIVRLATGFVTSIVFIDSTGAPWPVSDFSLGNPQGFNIKWDNKTNTLFVQSVKDHLSGNVGIRLADLDTPVMISLVTGQKEVDYRVDVQVPGVGPNGDEPVMNSLGNNGTNPALLAALDGVPPTGSIELNVAKEYGRAWLYNGKLLFRTRLTLLSPAWSSTVTGPDGTHVYELMQTPLMLASLNGKTIKIELSGL